MLLAAPSRSGNSRRAGPGHLCEGARSTSPSPSQRQPLPHGPDVRQPDSQPTPERGRRLREGRKRDAGVLRVQQAVDDGAARSHPFSQHRLRQAESLHPLADRSRHRFLLGPVGSPLPAHQSRPVRNPGWSRSVLSSIPLHVVLPTTRQSQIARRHRGRLFPETVQQHHRSPLDAEQHAVVCSSVHSPHLVETFEAVDEWLTDRPMPLHESDVGSDLLPLVGRQTPQPLAHGLVARWRTIESAPGPGNGRGCRPRGPTCVHLFRHTRKSARSIPRLSCQRCSAGATSFSRRAARRRRRSKQANVTWRPSPMSASAAASWIAA